MAKGLGGGERQRDASFELPTTVALVANVTFEAPDHSGLSIVPSNRSYSRSGSL